MTDFIMARADHRRVLDHLAFYGLADILASYGVPNVRLGWRGTEPVVSGDGLSAEIVDEAVRGHADTRSWIEESHAGRGTMSPRVTAPDDDDGWRTLQRARHAVLDEEMAESRWADLRFLGALGEPGYWRFYNKLRRPDEGASLWDMQPRNAGSELVGSRLRPLRAKIVARRTGTVAAGLSGQALFDDLNGEDPRGITATGLAMPGPVDGALVWCALWAVGQFPIGYRLNSRAITTGVLLRPKRPRVAYVPVWQGEITPSRLRTLLVSPQLAVLASGDEGLGGTWRGLDGAAASAWLRGRNVRGVYRFPMKNFGTEKAQEWRILGGEAVPLVST